MARPFPRLALLGALLVAGNVLAAEPAASEGFSAGLTVQPRASAADIGLPVYPGATPEKDRDDDSEGATISLWGGPFGMDLRVMKLRSSDSPEAVSRFYLDSLSRQGRVLDCSRGAPPEPAPPAASGSKLMRCGSDRAKAGGFLFKLQIPGGARMVSIEPAAGGSRIQLLRLTLRGE